MAANISRSPGNKRWGSKDVLATRFPEAFKMTITPLGMTGSEPPIAQFFRKDYVGHNSLDRRLQRSGFHLVIARYVKGNERTQRSTQADSAVSGGYQTSAKKCHYGALRGLGRNGERYLH